MRVAYVLNGMAPAVVTQLDCSSTSMIQMPLIGHVIDDNTRIPLTQPSSISAHIISTKVNCTFINVSV